MLRAGRWLDRMLLIVAAAATFGAGLIYVRRPPQTSAPPPSRALSSGKDTVALVFLDGRCAACRSEPNATKLSDALKRTHVITDRRLHVVGIALDDDPSEGIEYLSTAGVFDEISAGASWINSFVIDYIWADSIGVGAIPQLILLTRDVTIHDEGIRVNTPVVLARHEGMAEVVGWFEAYGRR